MSGRAEQIEREHRARQAEARAREEAEEIARRRAFEARAPHTEVERTAEGARLRVRSVRNESAYRKHLGAHLVLAVTFGPLLAAAILYPLVIRHLESRPAGIAVGLVGAIAAAFLLFRLLARGDRTTPIDLEVAGDWAREHHSGRTAPRTALHLELDTSDATVEIRFGDDGGVVRVGYMGRADFDRVAAFARAAGVRCRLQDFEPLEERRERLEEEALTRAALDAQQAIHDVVRRFQDGLRHGDLEAAYGQMHPRYRARHSVEAFSVTVRREAEHTDLTEADLPLQAFGADEAHLHGVCPTRAGKARCSWDFRTDTEGDGAWYLTEIHVAGHTVFGGEFRPPPDEESFFA